MRRRLKNEIYAKQKFHNVDLTVSQAQEFEDSLMRLAQLAKNKVKFEDFLAQDKYNLLDLFVNNEKTLLKIYEALFPHRVDQQEPQQSLATSVTIGFPHRGNSEAQQRNNTLMQQTTPKITQPMTANVTTRVLSNFSKSASSSFMRSQLGTANVTMRNQQLLDTLNRANRRLP